MDDAEKAAPIQRVIGRPFEAGKSGNPFGRPKGSRNKLGEAFIEALHEDFKTNGMVAIERCRSEKPDAYLKVIASILPKDVNLNVTALNDMSDDELFDTLATVRNLAHQLGLDGAASGGESSH